MKVPLIFPSSSFLLTSLLYFIKTSTLLLNVLSANVDSTQCHSNHEHALAPSHESGDKDFFLDQWGGGGGGGEEGHTSMG